MALTAAPPVGVIGFGKSISVIAQTREALSGF